MSNTAEIIDRLLKDFSGSQVAVAVPALRVPALGGLDFPALQAEADKARFAIQCVPPIRNSVDIVGAFQHLTSVVISQQSMLEALLDRAKEAKW